MYNAFGSFWIGGLSGVVEVIGRWGGRVIASLGRGVGHESEGS